MLGDSFLFLPSVRHPFPEPLGFYGASRGLTDKPFPTLFPENYTCTERKNFPGNALQSGGTGAAANLCDRKNRPGTGRWMNGRGPENGRKGNCRTSGVRERHPRPIKKAGRGPARRKKRTGIRPLSIHAEVFPRCPAPHSLSLRLQNGTHTAFSPKSLIPRSSRISSLRLSRASSGSSGKRYGCDSGQRSGLK